VKLLLDTHTFIWFILDHPNLSSVAKIQIEDNHHEILVSVVSLWEIAIKMSIGKLEIDASFDPFDRLLIAQSFVEQIPLISCDSVFKDYGIQLLW
jgi:PIN domain nuclease of toxin-antitoxin system